MNVYEREICGSWVKKQIEIESENDDYWLALAQTQMQLEDFSTSCESLDKCLSLNPEDEKANRIKESIASLMV